MTIYRFCLTATVVLFLAILPFVATRITLAAPIVGNSNETKASDTTSGRGVRSQPPTATANPPARQLPKRKGDITFDDLVFEIKKEDPFKRDMLTEGIEKLNGQTVQLRGYILPASVFQQRGINQFVLVRDDQECCFGPGAALYDCVMVQMKSPATAEFSTRPISVKGRFEVKEFKYPGDTGHYAVFQIEATQAE